MLLGAIVNRPELSQIAEQRAVESVHEILGSAGAAEIGYRQDRFLGTGNFEL